jgi:hypothetical protein
MNLNETLPSNGRRDMPTDVNSEIGPWRGHEFHDIKNVINTVSGIQI